MNKQLLSILSVVVSVALALAIYLYFAKIEDKSIKPVEIVPDNAVIIIESDKSTTHLKNIEGSAFMERILGNENAADFLKQIKVYDSLFQTNEIIGNWFAEGQAVYSFHSFENNSIGFFMSVQTGKDIDEQTCLSFFQTHFPGRYKMMKRKFQNQNLYDFTDFVEGTHFTIAFKSKLMLFSPDGALVEMALIKISQMSNQIPSEDKLGFVKNSGNGFNMYLKYKNIPGLLKGFTSDSLPYSFDILGNFGERAVYNIELDDEDIMLKGAAQTHETNFQYLDLLNAQAPIKNSLRPLLPDNIHFCYTLGFNGFQSFNRNVNEYLLSKKLFLPYRNYIDSIEKILQYPLTQKLPANFGNHIALFSIDEPGIWKDSCYVTAIEVTDEQGMLNLLKGMERAVQRLNETDSSKIIPDTVQSDVHPTYLGDAFKFYFSDLFEGFHAQYYIQYKGYFFFSNNPGILKTLQGKWANQKVLNKLNNFSDFESKLAPGSNFEVFINNEHAPKYVLNFLRNDWFSFVNRNMGSFKRARYTSVQFAGSNDKIFASQIYTQFNLNKAEKTEQVWAVPLDSAMWGAPNVIYNYALGSHVILVQDAKKQLYMVDREGKVLWKQMLEDKIISEIKEIDLYNNGKKQWLFNTAHYIYLMDENGKALSGWPVWIPTGTKYSVSVFEPENDRNYQIFASGSYYKISAFNQQGRLLPSWNPKEVWPNVASSVSMIKPSGKNVYWALNEKGKIIAFNAQAKQLDLFKLDSSISFLDIKMNQIDTGKIEIIGIDSNYLYQISWYSYKPLEMKKTASVGYTSVRRVSNGSGNNLLLLAGATKLQLVDEKGGQVLSKSFAETELLKPNWLFIGNSHKLVYRSGLRGTLNVENASKNAYKPFPISISSEYTIGNLFNEADNWLLFSDGSNQLNLYRVK
jgi:hypothetical protein